MVTDTRGHPEVDQPVTAKGNMPASEVLLWIANFAFLLLGVWTAASGLRAGWRVHTTWTIYTDPLLLGSLGVAVGFVPKRLAAVIESGLMCAAGILFVAGTRRTVGVALIMMLGGPQERMNRVGQDFNTLFLLSVVSFLCSGCAAWVAHRRLKKGSIAQAP
jgi:hypothetical protein